VYDTVIMWQIWIKYLTIVLRCFVHFFLKVSVATVLLFCFCYLYFFLNFYLPIWRLLLCNTCIRWELYMGYDGNLEAVISYYLTLLCKKDSYHIFIYNKDLVLSLLFKICSNSNAFHSRYICILFLNIVLLYFVLIILSSDNWERN
jgi:hypothetical protein